mmetsp:Transcript_24166/g.48177  ORF Transcript_24166/g.48177 Transcript_24166/m.48177 type:complete len:408 (+) Transcript_24166:22-1245(+)
MSRAVQILITTGLVVVLLDIYNLFHLSKVNWTHKTHCPQNRPVTRAVIHMGPHKTGSTTIQEFAHHHIDLLRKDGYEMPEVDNAEKNARGKTVSSSNHVRLATCFVDPIVEDVRTIYPCDPDRLLHGLDLAAKGHNVFITAETLDKIDREGIEMLKSYLSHWIDVTIMIFYRRYYDWLPSVFNEIQKSLTLAKREERGESIVDFLLQNSKSYHDLYVASLFDRLQQKFDKKNIIVLDYHDTRTRGPDETLFCNMPNAAQMCNASRNTDGSTTNPSVNLAYSDLAHGARKAGLISISNDERMKQVVKSIESYYKSSLNGRKLYRICPSSNILENLWNLTLAAESKFNPNNNPRDFDELRLDFDMAARNKLCALDVAKTLNDPTWKGFFGMYNRRNKLYRENKVKKGWP